MRRAAAGLILSLALGGCLFGPTVVCDDNGWEEGFTCEAVISAARTQLAGHTDITTLTAVQGRHCSPPGSSCPATPFVTTVYADRIDGSQLYVMVLLQENGGLRAEPAMPVEEAP